MSREEVVEMLACLLRIADALEKANRLKEDKDQNKSW